jgi:hypothetical protein
MPRAKSSQIELLKKTYSDHCENISKELAGLISTYGPSAFSRLPHMPDNPINSYIPEDIFESALEQLPPDPPDALTDDQKKKKLDSIQEKMNKEKAKIKKLTPQAYIMMRRGNVECDSRKEFINHWRRKQGYVIRPCNAQGLDLELASDDEKWLYKKLKIGACILPGASKLPYRP